MCNILQQLIPDMSEGAYGSSCICSKSKYSQHFTLQLPHYYYSPRPKCLFTRFILKSIFCVWHNTGFNQLIIREISTEASLATYQDFLA